MFITLVLVLVSTFHKTLCLTDAASKLAEVDKLMINILKNPRETDGEVLVTKLKLFTAMVTTLTKRLKEEHTKDVLRDCRDVYGDVMGYSLLYYLDKNRTENIKNKLGWDNSTFKNFQSLMFKAENAWVELFDCYEKADKTGLSLPDVPTSSDAIDSTNYDPNFTKDESNSEDDEESNSSLENKPSS